MSRRLLWLLSASFPTLDIEPKVHHIALFDHVLLALQPQLARLLGARLPLERNEVIVGNDLRPDEAALEVRMDDAGRLRRGRPRVHRPGAHLFDAGREIGL